MLRLGLPEGYQLRVGSKRDRALLLKFLRETYQELFPNQKSFSHLAQTVQKYLSSDTPLWWVEVSPKQKRLMPVACLWMGNAIDQVEGDRYAHIFLLYVKPEHRREGIGKALITIAENWARSRGDRRISLQVFTDNQPAFNLYKSLGFHTQSLMMVKPLRTGDND